MPIFIRNGRVVDPTQGIDRVTDIRISGGKIDSIDAVLQEGDEIIEASGKIVAPGLIDMHVHLREPGTEEDETIETGTKAAICGGYTTIACCPNTNPPLDSQGTVELVRQKAARAGNCNVYVIACISKGREGKELAELGRLFEAGAVACSDDGAPISDAELMRRAFEYCLMFDKPILSHSEDLSLTKGGVMHEGAVSMQLGLPGMPAAAEDVMISRDITLAELTGGRLHVMHVSTAGSVHAIRRAKHRGVKVTVEVTPHHLCLTDECLRSFDSNFKMSPPLRGEEHVRACIEGVGNGTIDAIASDHAPHAPEKKMRELNQAPFGIVGLETTLSIVVTKLIRPGLIDWPRAISLMSSKPAEILGIPKGTLKIGADADITIVDPEASWTVSEETLHSKSKNSPFIGTELYGRASTVILGGKIKHAV